MHTVYIDGVCVFLVHSMWGSILIYFFRGEKKSMFRPRISFVSGMAGALVAVMVMLLVAEFNRGEPVATLTSATAQTTPAPARVCPTPQQSLMGIVRRYVNLPNIP